jgi:hypothetical protein
VVAVAIATKAPLRSSVDAPIDVMSGLASLAADRRATLRGVAFNWRTLSGGELIYYPLE